MGADTYTRVNDFSDDEDNNLGGRSSVRTAQLDAELDAALAVINAHAADIDVLLRDDNKVQDDLLEGHEFSTAALNFLAAQIGTNSALVWQGDWAASTDYVVGNLVYESGNAYICLVAHNSDDYASFSAALSAGAWDLFAQSGSAGLPSQSGNANKVLKTNGSATSWSFVTTTEAPSLAPLASPALTGTFTSQNATLGASASHTITMNGRLVSAVKTYTFGTTLALALNAEFMQSLQLTGSSAWTVGATTGLTAGAMADIRIIGSTSGDIAVTWPTGWKWLGYKPTTLTQDIVGMLSLRCYGSSESDVVASWIEE